MDVINLIYIFLQEAFVTSTNHDISHSLDKIAVMNSNIIVCMWSKIETLLRVEYMTKYMFIHSNFRSV